MKNFLCLATVSLLLVSCATKKEILINSFPEGAEVTINGNPVGVTPVIATVEQDKALGIVARKDGYEIGAETISPVSSKFLSFIWTENDPKSKYIAEDTITIPLKKIATPATYTPSPMPPYTGGGGATKAALPEAPELRPMPNFD